MTRAYLMQVFHFDEAELQENRNGRISEKQMARLHTNEKGFKAGAFFIGTILMLSALLGWGIAGISLFAGDNFSEDMFFRISMAVVFGCLWPLVWGSAGIFTMQRAFTKIEMKVNKVEGSVNIIKVIRSSYNSKAHTHSDHSVYELCVGTRIFDVHAELPSAMKQGDVYAVYFVDFVFTNKRSEVLSVEWLSPANAAPASLPLTNKDAEVVELVKKGNILEAIRAHRVIHNSGFEEAKGVVDNIRSHFATVNSNQEGM